MKILTKFPNRQELLPVFSLILFIVSSWTIFRMFFQIPSWLFSHTKLDMFFLAAYVFAFALMESVILLGFILLINLILPRRFLKDQFVAAGSLLVIACTIWALVLQYQADGFGRRTILELSAWLFLFFFTLILLSFGANFIINRYNRVRDALEAIADRTVIFAWIYIPVGIISLGIVFVRNIL